MPQNHPLQLFQAFGVELEYMIVDARTLDILPITDELLRAAAGEYVSDVEMGDVAWSNELVLHVVELKTNGPATSLELLASAFQQNVGHINRLLKPFHARLLPSAMHPWMDPHREMKLWPHDCSPIYEAFNRIFDCRGHGWANLQSTHLNLPFADDAEFARLHAAIRLLLPILPALAASSPVMDGRLTGLLDNRMDVYRGNSRRMPSLSGRIIPESVFTRAAYENEILRPMYSDIAPFDPDGVLQDEFLNARGAIARFCRNTIEIRVVDVQECPQADVAVCAAMVGVLEALVAERWTRCQAQKSMDTDPLVEILSATIRDADRAVITDAAYLRHFGYEVAAPADRDAAMRSSDCCTAGELWRHLIETTCLTCSLADARWGPALRNILQHGPLARRISDRLAGDTSRDRLFQTYSELADCLADGKLFGVEGA